jgi:hypothetical protein
MTTIADTGRVHTSRAVATNADVQRHARTAGILYLLTFASSIPALLLLGPVLNDAAYITGAGSDTRVLWGCLLDVVNAVTAVGTAVALYPVIRRRHPSFALGFVTSRMFEAAVIMIGVVSLVAVVTLRQDYAGDAGTDAAALTTVGHALVEVRNWTFLFGPGLVPAFNALFLGTVLYRTGLVPRVIPAVGLVGAPLLFASAIATVFGAVDQTGHTGQLLALPIAAWEFSVGVWMAVKGFDRDAVERLG